MKLLNGNAELVDLTDIKRDDISIEMIANATSKICRYTGNPRRFYSVAEHMVHLSRVVPRHLRRAAMIHDDHEMFISDLAHPVKVEVPQYKPLESKVQIQYLNHYGVTLAEIEELEWYDRNICGDEMFALYGYLRPNHEINMDVVNAVNNGCWGWKKAKKKFIKRFIEVF